MKRIFDVVASGLGLVIFAFPLLVIGCLITLTSGFPATFRQTRVGRRGRDFTLIKFRTMTVCKGTEKGSFDAGSARRVTAVGRVLRKTKLDELPQLWNVLKGDMSLVGPRPEVRKWVEACPERWNQVLVVRPGVTDPASILYRNEEEILAASPNPEWTYRNEILPRKLDLYEQYVRTQSFWGDIVLIIRTIRAVASR